MSSSPLPPDPRTRAADLFAGHITALCRRLARRYPRVDPDALHDAAVDAILLLDRQPQRFDPDRGTLPTFLFAIARRVLNTSLRGDGRRKKREQEKIRNDVTERPAAAKSPLDELIDREQLERFRARLARTEEERIVLDLMLLGERDPARFADALLAGHLTLAERRARADTVYCRIRQRISRLRRRLQEEPPP